MLLLLLSLCCIIIYSHILYMYIFKNDSNKKDITNKLKYFYEQIYYLKLFHLNFHLFIKSWVSIIYN